MVNSRNSASSSPKRRSPNTWFATASHPRKPGGPSWRIIPRNWSRPTSLWFPRRLSVCSSFPWQNPYCERLIGSIRRECLDHFIVFHERGLHRTLKSYFEYYEQSRTHLSLDKDAPLTRAIHPPEMGRVIELPQVGGLHHRYERRPA